jgi:anti-anti-sigma factor
MAPLFDLVERPLDTRTRLLAPRGELDAATNPAFSAAVQAHADRDGERLVVDLSEVSFMSAGAMGVLARARATIERKHGQLVVVCPSPGLYRLFEIAGLAGKLDIRRALTV